jgi:hypothetical protein
MISIQERKLKKTTLMGINLTIKKDIDIQVFTTNIFFVNKNLYSFSYKNEKGLNETDKNTFFSAITFNHQKKLLQYPIKSLSFIKKIILVLF